MVVSDSFVKRVAEEGLRIREYAPPAGGGVQCTVTAEDDFLIARLSGWSLRLSPHLLWNLERNVGPAGDIWTMWDNAISGRALCLK